MSDDSDEKKSNNNDNDNNKKSTNGNELPLDWTKPSNTAPCEVITLPRDVCPYAEDETDLTIVGTHGRKLTKMGSDLSSTCPDLSTLVLRSHLLSRMEGLGQFNKLEVLELYDNSIGTLEGLEAVGSTLRVLDMSYNVIRDMEPVKHCPNLTELYLAQNKLKSIAGLRNLSKLRKIDLGANRIRIMDEEELSGLTNLEELWLGKNKIEEIDGIKKLTKLRRLDVQANRLTKIQNLSKQAETLEELYLADNGIKDDGAAATFRTLSFPQLTVLDMCKNRLTTVSPFSNLLSLEELWLTGNDIKTFADVRYIENLGAREGACLEGIYLDHNPVSKEFEYRKVLMKMLPSLQQIDADRVDANMFGGGVGGMPSLEERMKGMQQAAFDLALQQQGRQKSEGDT